MFDAILVRAGNPGPMTGEGNNTYLLVGQGGAATLIDAGEGHDAHLRAVAGQLARTRASLRQVLVTHAHPDHAAGAPAIKAAHPGAVFRKHPWPEQDPRFAVGWQALDDRAAVDIGGDTLIVLHTPGHSPDHVAFWHAPSRTIFAGDLVVAGGSVMIHASRGGDLGAYLASLDRLRALEPSRILPAHGAPLEDPVPVLTRAIEHRLAREEQVLRALAAGRDTMPAIVESIYDGLNPALLPAAHETVRAHLEKLRREGRAVADADRWSAR